MTNTQPVKIWTTRDGQQIPLTEMSNSHLTNAIAYLERTAEERRDAQVWALIDGPRPQGELAQEAFANEICEMDEWAIDRFLASDEIYQSLVTELKRRRAK